MGLRDRLQRLGVELLVERPVRRKSLDELAATLERSGARLEQRFGSAAGTPENCARLRHIVGIERWGQQRLRVGLGTPLTLDDYDGYQPEPSLDWAGMRTAFQSARQETIALAQALAVASSDAAMRVPHNQLGPLSLRAWLRYLNLHANIEAQSIR